ncbi:ATP-dependent zinc metalloprotease FtsH [Desulfolithobacter dissulfuricans]|uniref:ATP-dependent zinc metalloprotease FtsH n=1 Tax=Desulfolithobacter dissulfuricans TaxID=2795293 RepID=A0A915XJJ8_9BACT|nr:ATP-dependent zinc metalloprotease FtsH [Desulfolithobacter dissulfuricans]
MNKNTEQKTPYPAWMRYVLIGLVAAFAYYWLSIGLRTPEPSYEIAYSQFKTFVQKGQVQEVIIRGLVIEGVFNIPMPIGPQQEVASNFSTRLPSFGDESLIPVLESQNVNIMIAEERGKGTLMRVLLVLLPWVLLMLFFYFIYSRTARNLGGTGELKKFLESPVKEAGIPEVTFADVAGQDNAKREISELIEFLKHPEQFRKLGAEIPRGVLLMGAPGTGKTLLAKALAGEAGVPFFFISGSEFIEVFVGVGASRVRNLFAAAKKNAPSIIFVDELDSVGRTRGTGLGGGHDEREQTLNQILAELDGFTGRENVIVLAATNRPDVLDPALLRPGRFDRHVTLDLPDRKDRIALLKVHTRNVPLADDVELDKIAAGSPGFSGADIKNLVNEAAILAARCKRETVLMQDFDEARDRLLLGSVRTMAIQPEERHRLAVHEAGHTIVAYYIPHADPLYKVSIIPRGRALGGTQQISVEERHTLPEEYLRDRITVILGGAVQKKNCLDPLALVRMMIFVRSPPSHEPWWLAGACRMKWVRLICAKAKSILFSGARSLSPVAIVSIPPRP